MFFENDGEIIIPDENQHRIYHAEFRPKNFHRRMATNQALRELRDRAADRAVCSGFFDNFVDWHRKFIIEKARKPLFS